MVCIVCIKEATSCSHALVTRKTTCVRTQRWERRISSSAGMGAPNCCPAIQLNWNFTEKSRQNQLIPNDVCLSIPNEGWNGKKKGKKKSAVDIIVRTYSLWWPGILRKLARYPHSGQSSLIVMTTPYPEKEDEPLHTPVTLRHFLFFFFQNIFLTWNKHEKVTEGHLNSRPLWFFFLVSFFFIFFFHLSAVVVVPFFRFFYELLLRSLSDIFLFLKKKEPYFLALVKEKRRIVTVTPMFYIRH